jgi:hypothetical protein
MDGNLEAFAISFAKLVQIMERVDIHKTIDVDVWVQVTRPSPTQGRSRALGPTRIPRRWL